jgi:hypothetical protein
MGTAWPIATYLDPDAELEVSVAWGADLTADPDGWVWTEITADVRDAPGIQVSRGRGDEASAAQPATCTFTLDNRTGAYSVGGESPNWPYVRQGTPVRVRVDPDGSGPVVLFQGSADGFTPFWPHNAVPEVQVSASGALRRLGQGRPPVESAMRRAVMNDSRVRSYWTCEDSGDVGGFLATTGPYFLTWDQFPELAKEPFFECSKPLPVLKGSMWTGLTEPSTTGEFLVRFLAKFPDDLAAVGTTGAHVMTIFTSGTACIWVLDFFDSDATGEFQLSVYDRNLSLLHASSVFVAYVVQPAMGVLISISGNQVGADVEITYTQSALLPDSAYTFGFTETLTTDTCGNVTGIWVNNGGLLDEVTIGHVTIYDEELSFADGLAAARAYRGEFVDDRVNRLESETGEAIDQGGISFVTMGAQLPTTFLELVRECETADGGVLYDGETHGLSYQCRENRENRPADLTLDATDSAVKPLFEPAHDDQQIRNRAAVTRTGTSRPFEYADVTGPMGTDTIGTYDTSVQASLYDDFAAFDLAGWLVHLGTVPGYRYPQVTVNLATHPELAADVLALKPGHRIDITNLDQALDGHPGSGPLALAVEGLTHHLSAMSWIVTFRCSLYEPWDVLELEDSEVSPISFVSSGSVTAGSNTSLLVDTPPDYSGDDLLLLVASIRNSGTGTVDTPAGWTPLVSSGNVAVFGWVEAREIEGPGVAEPTVVTFSGGAANATTMGVMLVYRGTAAHRLAPADLADVIHAQAVQLNASAQNIAYPGLTITDDNVAVVLVGWKADDWSSAAAVAGFTEASDAVSTLGDDAGTVIEHDIRGAASNLSSGSIVITGGASAISRGLAFALAPDPTPAKAPQLDTTGSHLNASILAGATSMSVYTESVTTISYVGANVPAVGNNASVAPPLPTGLEPGDLMVITAAIRNSGTGTVNTPAGWTVLATTGNLTALGRLYVNGDAAPTVAFTGGVANATTIAQCVAWRGACRNISEVVHASAVQLNASAQNVAYPALTVTEDGCAVMVLGWKQDDWTSTAAAGGFALLMDSPTVTGDDAGLTGQRVTQTTATNIAAGSITVTGGASAISRAITLAIRPQPGVVWTTTAADYPIDLDVGGVRITATASADTSSPQTMTINAAPVARTAGMPVKLWKPPGLGRAQGQPGTQYFL